MGPVTTAPVLRTVFTIFSADLSTRLWSYDCNFILIRCDICKELYPFLNLECKGKGVNSFHKHFYKVFSVKGSLNFNYTGQVASLGMVFEFWPETPLLLMMKYLFLPLLVLSSFNLFAQRLHADLYAGVANYQGDLQTKRFTLTNSGPAVGLGLSYDLTSHIIIRGVASYMKVSGEDATSNNKGTLSRNLSFESSIWEAQLAGEYNLFDMEERSFTPYVFAGVAAFHFNPYAFDAKGNKQYLRSLTTEGQGLPAYPEKKMYGNNQVAIPFGGGLKLALTDNLQVGVELGLRKLFTDYLDDVSGTYADSTLLAAARGPEAAAMAYRGGEIAGAPPYPAAGSQRGNAGRKDWYYTTGLRISYLLGNGNGGGRRNKTKTGCPVNIY